MNNRLAFGSFCVATLFLVGCSSPAPRSMPRPPADLIHAAEPIPRHEPLADKGNHSPYRVLGRTYTVMNSSNGYVERGIASWYGKKFHGRPTSTMETYDMYQFTAAHKSLPLPTYAEVTNLDNGKRVTVRINDRGPFKDERIIDLSYAAALRLGMIKQGTARVEVRAINPGGPLTAGLNTYPREAVSIANTAVNTPAQPAPEAVEKEVKMFLQIGAFTDLANAWTIVDQLHEAGLEGVRLHSDTTGPGMVHKVRIGPVEDEASVNRLTEQVRQMGLDSPRPIFR